MKRYMVIIFTNDDSYTILCNDPGFAHLVPQ